MKTKIAALIISVLSLPLAVSSLASAHVVVTPDTAAAADRVTFSVSVPNEKDVPVTGLRLTIPAGIKGATPTVHPGWTITTTKDGETIKEITWTGGEIPAGQRDDFTFRAQAPERTGEIVWKAYQTYADGTTASWDQPPADGGHSEDQDDKGPYSVTTISDNDDSQAVASTANNSSVSSVLPLIASLVALVVSIVALQRTSSKR